jgi:biotin carboxyl carrier protein
MTFDIEINGRPRSVSVERTTGGHYHVVIDGKAREVDGARVGLFGLSLILDHDSGLSREVQVAPATGAGDLLVTLDGRVASAAINRRRTARGGADGGAAADGEQAILAPMPGRVVRVLVAPGDEVAARQGVVVVEAMKMENELRSPKAGRVKDVLVTPGTSVDAGRVLVIVE